MANITLLGASYTDVPAVDLPQTGGGTVRFYENGGGGSSYTRTVVCPLQNFTLPSDNNYIDLTDAQRLIAMSNYIITYDSVEYICTAGELWGSDRFLGDLVLTWGSASGDYIFPFCVEDWNGNPGPTVYARDKNQHSIKIERLELS